MAPLQIVAEPHNHEIVLTRTFDAPRDLVFKVLTDPAHIPHWWGPKRYSTTVDTMDVRPGGLWRFVQSDQKGSEFAFHGVYHTVMAPEQLVYTFEFEGMAGHVMLETVTLAEHDGKTTLTDRAVFQTIADRDGMLQSGMAEGAGESMDRLADLLTNL